MATEDGPVVKASVTSFEVLEGVRELDGAGVSELARHLDRSKSGVYKHVNTLVDRGYLVEEDGGYHIGMRLWTLGATVRERFPVEEGRASVDSLAASTNHAVSFVVYEERTATCAYQNRPPEADRLPVAVGESLPLHATAAGKAILAYLPEERRERVLDQLDLSARTPETTTDRAALAAELDAVRERRTAFEREEYVEGVQCVAAPVLDGEDEPLGAIYVAGPADEMRGEYLEEDAQGLVVSTSRSVENALPDRNR